MVVLGDKEKSFRSVLNQWKKDEKVADKAPLHGLVKTTMGSLVKHNRPAIQQYRSRRGLDKKQSSRRLNTAEPPRRFREIFGIKLKRVKKDEVVAKPSSNSDKMTRQEKDLLQSTLKTSFLFDQMDEQALEKIIVEGFEPVTISKAQQKVIFQQGQQADYFYVIAQGQVEFERDGQVIGTTAGVGKSFGELALLHQQPRSATVIAKSMPAKLFRLDQQTFTSISQSQIKQTGKTKRNLLFDIDFLKEVGRFDLIRLARAMKPRLFQKGEVLVKRGEKGNWFYILQEGEVQQVEDDDKEKPKIIKPGSYFGEQSILTGETATFTVIATTNGTAYSIDNKTFGQVLGKFSRVIMASQKRRALERLDLFQDLNLEDQQFDELTNLMFDETFQSQDLIFETGKKTDAALYFVYEGTVQLSGSRNEVIKPGMFFGQEHLDLNKSKFEKGPSSIETVATYSAAAAGNQPCICAVLTLADSLFVFPTPPEEDETKDPSSNPARLSKLRLSNLTEEEILEAASAPPSLTLDGTTTSTWLQEHSLANIRLQVRSQVNLDDLDRISMLGEGQFGEVWLVRPLLSSLHTQRFALKIQAKEDDIRGDEAEELITREINVLEQMDHPYIVNLVHQYEDADNRYILMGIVPGGELWEVIHQEGDDGEWSSGLPEDDAKFYAMMITDTLNYMHRKRYVFRDLKPENVLIDRDGYPVVCDFGFAKQLPDGDESYTLCGTPNYLAPEIVMNRGHSFGVDHWALGVLIYEMLDGENPFFVDDMDQMTLFNAITNEKHWALGEDVSPDAKDLVDGLLVKDPVQRLGSLAGRGKDILNMPWFDGLNLRDLRKKRFQAPYVPARGALETIVDEEEETDSLL